MVLYGFLNVIKSSVVLPQLNVALNVLLLTLLQLLVGDANYKRGEIGHPLSNHNHRINKKRSEEINVFLFPFKAAYLCLS